MELPFPAKCLWPNGRSHWATKARAFKKAKEFAYYRTRENYPMRVCDASDKRVNWSVTIHPKTRNVIDDDNARASLKAYQDGLALALGVDDSQFNAPKLTFGEPIKGGLVRIVIEP